MNPKTKKQFKRLTKKQKPLLSLADKDLIFKALDEYSRVMFYCVANGGNDYGTKKQVNNRQKQIIKLKDKLSKI